jgi:ribonucleoside-diphosphate reductase beta chain
MNSLITRDPSRLLLRVEHDDLWDLYLTHQEAFWVASEIDFSSDYADFETLSKDEQHFIKKTIAFLSCADGIVVESMAEKFISKVPFVESRCFYGFQIMIENVHAEVYSEMVQTVTKYDEEEQEQLFNAVFNDPAIQGKIVWAERWITDPTVTFVEGVVAFAAWEGIGFSTSFATMYWIKSKGLMKGTIQANEFITRDEDLHVDHGCMVYNKLPLEQRLSTERVHQIIGEAVELEKVQVRDALRVTIAGLNSKMMCEYVEYIADRLLKDLGHPTMFQVGSNPLPFMDLIGLQGRTSFFEKRNTDYRRSGIVRKKKRNNYIKVNATDLNCNTDISKSITKQINISFDADF